jgi:hypothetical protein
MTMDRDDHPALMTGANLATGNEVQGRGAAETEALSEGFRQGTRTAVQCRVRAVEAQQGKN